TIERVAGVSDAWLSAMPNAGRPRDIEGRNIYLSSPEYMASYARRFVGYGVRLVGGCCGTTPEHIRQISLAVKALAPALGRAARGQHDEAAVEVRKAPHAQAPAPQERKSRLGHLVARGKRVIAIELPPPRGLDCQHTVDQAKELRIRGVDVVTIPDTPRAGARMSALALAVLIEQQAGIETVLQYSCRDRNLVGIQSDLLGAHAMGLRNVLGVTGDARMLGDIPDATAVFDVDSIGLTHVITRLNHGLDVGGQPIGAPTAFLSGVMINPGAPDLDREVRRFEYKVEAGAEFVVTRPIFDVDAFGALLARIGAAGVPIIAGIWPFESILNAEFMANEVPGVSVPDRLVERMRRTGGPDEAAAEGVAIAREIVAALSPMVHGVQVSAPSGRLDLALDVLDGLG
ncbi:MAG: methylenetetrahydrofolate reductase, partial [Vicinamibacterales bacterium]